MKIGTTSDAVIDTVSQCVAMVTKNSGDKILECAVQTERLGSAIAE